MAYDNLEDAQARILELEEQNDRLEHEKETLSQNNEELTKRNEELRSKNQMYFDKLIAQEDTTKKKEEDEGEEDIPSCEEFAKSLKIF